MPQKSPTHKALKLKCLQRPLSPRVTLQNVLGGLFVTAAVRF